MIVQSLHGPFEIVYAEVEVCPVAMHRNTFFELVFIVKGAGIQHVNGQVLNYAADNLFLLMPQDVHHFTCNTTTGFLFIRFNDIYLESQKAKSSSNNLGDWIPKMEYIFHNSVHRPGCIVGEESDKPLVKALAEAVLREYKNQQSFHREILQQLVNTLITVVARNISPFSPEAGRENGGPGLDIVNYIHQNIYSPELLKAGALAARFNISANYISEYFKKQTGEGLQQYVTHYKLKLVETRLRYSDLRMNEIVSELGFTDESHLNRTFKKYKGVNPSAFRRQARAEVDAPRAAVA